MKRITCPLKIADQGIEITNLHECLKRLDIVIAAAEVSKNLFGKKTDVAIRKFEQINQPSVIGNADEATVKQLNDLSEEKGAFKNINLSLYATNR